MESLPGAQMLRCVLKEDEDEVSSYTQYHEGDKSTVLKLAEKGHAKCVKQNMVLWAFCP